MLAWDVEVEETWERLWENDTCELFGGLKDEVWRRHVVDEISSGRFMPEIDCRPPGWCDNNPLAQTHERFLLWQIQARKISLDFERAMDVMYAQYPPPIQIPSGAAAFLMPHDTDIHASARPSLTQMPALAADSEQEPYWVMTYSSDSEDELLLHLDDESAMARLGYRNDPPNAQSEDFLAARLRARWTERHDRLTGRRRIDGLSARRRLTGRRITRIMASGTSSQPSFPIAYGMIAT